MQYIQGGGMVPGKPEDKNFYQGEFGGQIGVMCDIEILESIVGSTTLVVMVRGWQAHQPKITDVCQ